MGTAVYFALKAWVGVLIPDAAQGTAGFALPLAVGQIGVCFSFWSLAWGLVFENPSVGLRPAGEKVVRLLIVAALASATYVGYTHGFSVHILHEPATAGSFGGDPLTGMDWLILVLLWYALSLGHYGSTRPDAGVVDPG